jgi:hypothetical protein
MCIACGFVHTDDVVVIDVQGMRLAASEASTAVGCGCGGWGLCLQQREKMRKKKKKRGGWKKKNPMSVPHTIDEEEHGDGWKNVATAAWF